MVFNLTDLKDVCSKILTAVDSSENSQITDTLELEVKNSVLNLSVTNREYFVRVKLSLTVDVAFHASVNAGLFLKLISSLTSETVELEVVNTFLKVTGDGIYKIPLIYDGNNMLVLPEITISNKTKEFTINKDNLMSILKYNMNELNKGVTLRPVQNLLYLDENGCITFTTGACVTNFSLPSPIKILLTPKVVKLFKLFKDETVNFQLGQDQSGNVIQTKVVLSDSTTTLSSILPSDSAMINSVPVTAIRNRATCAYNYSVNINKDSLLNAIKRISLFAPKSGDSNVSLTFKDTYFVVSDNVSGQETINYDSNSVLTGCDYSGSLRLNDLKLTLETCQDKYIVFNFGNHQAMVISRSNVYNVLPEIV